MRNCFFQIARILTFFMLLLGGISCRCDNKKIEKPNILFILLDDLGKEWFKSYGAGDIETPTIDELARQGMLFENCYSMPQCTPTRITLLTGQYPFRHGWINHYDVPRWGHRARFDSEKNPFLGKIMKGFGYKTCVAGKWQINDFRLEPEVMEEHGFDAYCMWTGGEGGNLKNSGKRYWDPYIHTKEGSRTYKGQFGEDIFSDFIIDFMRKHKEDPMMIYYPMCLPHLPFTTTPIEPQVEGEERHKAMVRYTDFILKKLLKALEELEIRDRTLVFFSTDNGTSSRLVGSLNGRPVRGGKSYLTENGLNAPFIANCPGVIPAGKVSDALIDFTDLLPTFVDLAGGMMPENFVFDGHSFAELLQGKSDKTARDYILGMGSHPACLKDGKVVNGFEFRDRVIRNKRYKAYFSTKGELYRIFDLREDPMETNNLIDSRDSLILKQKKEFVAISASWPKKDANPLYSPTDTSLWDIDEVELQIMCEKGMRRSNMAPMPR